VSNWGKILVLAACLMSILFFGLSRDVDAQATAAAVFEGKNTLLRPEGYREWVFVGSSLGLSYAQNPPAERNPSRELYHNVYINPALTKRTSLRWKLP
jgi:hypothetical protein